MMMIMMMISTTTKTTTIIIIYSVCLLEVQHNTNFYFSDFCMNHSLHGGHMNGDQFLANS